MLDIDTAKKYASLPKTGGPRREQPAWDRGFSGRAELKVNLDGRTDKMKNHIVEAVAFSDVIKGGYTPEELAEAGKAARHFIAKEARKNGK